MKKLGKAIKRVFWMIVAGLVVTCVTLLVRTTSTAPHWLQIVMWVALVASGVAIAAKSIPAVRLILQWAGVAVMLAGGGTTLYALLIAPFWVEMVVASVVIAALAWFVARRLWLRIGLGEPNTNYVLSTYVVSFQPAPKTCGPAVVCVGTFPIHSIAGQHF